MYSGVVDDVDAKGNNLKTGFVRIRLVEGKPITSKCIGKLVVIPDVDLISSALGKDTGNLEITDSYNGRVKLFWTMTIIRHADKAKRRTHSIKSLEFHV